MLNILIIDDEKLVRAMVRQCVDWGKIGLCVAGEASSARMGIDMIKEMDIDIVIMDIKMPGMNGLECSQLILEKHPRMKIIILSGHDDFEYASKGIHIGIFDYLLKPVNADELQNAAVKAREKILEEKKHKEELEGYKKELEKHSSYIKERQLNNLVYSSTPDKCIESLDYFGVQIKNDVFQVALVQTKMQEDFPEEKKILLRMHLKKLVEDFFYDMPGIYITDNGTAGVLIINNADKNAIYNTGEQLHQYLSNNMEADTYIAVGNAYQELEGLQESYREAKDAQKGRFLTSEDVNYYRDIYPYYDTNISIRNEEMSIHELSNAIRMGDEYSAVNELQMILDRFLKMGGKREQAIILAMEILTEIMKALAQLHIMNYPEMLDDSTMIGGVFLKDTFEEIGDYLREVIVKASAMIKTEVTGKEKSLVQQVQDYINEHYSNEDISLNKLAQHYYVNASYLSRVFKEKTNSTFTKYIFEVRMKEAQKLVRHTDLKAYEIAEQVGIIDPHYFSSCFKKYTGMSVAEYKKS